MWSGADLMFEIIFYKDKHGFEPLKAYLYDLAHRGRTSKKEKVLFEKILAYLKVLSERGTRIGEPVVKHIEDKLWELRPLNNRIFFFYWKDDAFVMVHHFIKQTQRTPKREIDKARSNMAEFIERNERP
jgi:phage-related protein